MPVPVILDCDPGHDDAFAIWLAAGDPEIRLLAITTVGGNGDLEHTRHNARVVCTVAGVRDVALAAGAGAPLTRQLHPASHIHGATALDGPVSPEPRIGLDPRSALRLQHDLLVEAPEPVVIIATGPLTNIALLVRAHPDVLPKIREIVWMGGSTGRGNITPYAEFNAWTDPEAAAVVVGSGVPFTMVGLNVSHKVLATPEVRAGVAAIGNTTAVFGAELLDFYSASYRRCEGLPAGPLHDPITVALVAAPELVTTVRTRLDVEVHGTETAGATSVDLGLKLNRPANAQVAVDIDVAAFWKKLKEAILQLR